MARLFSTGSPASRLLRPLVNRLAPEGPAWVAVRSGPAQGVRLLIDTKKEKFLWTGLHEPAVQEAISRLLRPGMSFWDIGAHVGFFTVLGARLVGDEGSVHAFEPVEENRRRLQSAVEKNGCRNITIHEVALSATPGEAVLHTHESSAMWSLAGESAEGVTVRCETLDSLDLPPPDLIKIDAEGVEVEVLRGGRKLLSDAERALLVEFTTPALVDEARELLPAYSFEHLAGNHWLLMSH
ncbi:MAG: FkbM family methyltransferase [Actinobacteria bacterium]|nr:FkbM family methyltransferase [Actinomycetota bacterium]